MAFIDIIGPENATGDLATLYDRIRKARGGVAAVHQVQSLHPHALRAHLELYHAVVLAPSALSRIQRERIAVVVSAENACRYCIEHHAEALLQLGDEPSIVTTLRQGQTPTDLPPPERGVLDWARRAARRPVDCGAEDIDALRAHGLDDRAILDATFTVAYFSFVNRLVLLLGVALEENVAPLCGSNTP